MLTSVHAGFTSDDAARRLLASGPNESRRDAGPAAWTILASRLASALVAVLVLAAILAAVMGDILEAAAIGAIIVANAMVGFVQELRSERAIEAVCSLGVPQSRVIRDGRSATIATAGVVPGDILIVEAGDLVAADARVLEAHRFATNEAPLTGESTLLDKHPVSAGATVDASNGSRDRLVMGTAVVSGTGLAEVTAIGMATELGKIAGLLSGVRAQPTPRQRQLDRRRRDAGRGLPQCGRRCRARGLAARRQREGSAASRDDTRGRAGVGEARLSSARASRSTSHGRITPRSAVMSPRHCLAIALTVAACRLDAGTEPHDMGAAHHAQRAERESVRAGEHTEQARTRASVGDAGCVTFDRSRFGPVCWTPDDHFQVSDEHRELAQRHRAASAKLRQAEATACVDIADDDRDSSPFAHRLDVRSVERMEASTPTTTTAFRPRVVGARIVFRAVPGMSAEWLQRVVDCHLARNAALGHARAGEDMPYCPLTLAGVRADVRFIEDGFAVAVTADDPATATEILRRARLLEGQVAP